MLTISPKLRNIKKSGLTIVAKTKNPTKPLDEYQLDINSAKTAVDEAKTALLGLQTELDEANTAAEAALEDKKEDAKKVVDNATINLKKANEEMPDLETVLIDASKALTDATEQLKEVTELKGELKTAETAYNIAKVHLDSLTDE